MARIKLEIPAHIISSCTIPVRITDINYGNHVGNDAFVAIIHEARMLWLKVHGFTELDIEGVGLIMSGLAVEFKNEALYGDSIIVQIAPGEISKQWFELFYKLSVKRSSNTLQPEANDHGTVLAHASTTMVCYDYATKKTVGIPAKLKLILDGNALA